MEVVRVGTKAGHKAGMVAGQWIEMGYFLFVSCKHLPERFVSYSDTALMASEKKE